MNALIPLLGSKKKANNLLTTYLNLADTASADIGLFMKSLEAQLLALEESALNTDSSEAQAEIINQAMRLALVKCSIRSMGGKVEHVLISSMLEYGLFTPAQAIQTAAQQKHASFTYTALIDLAPHLNAEHLDAAIDVATGLADEYRRLFALAHLVLHLDPPRRDEWGKTLLDELPSPLEGQKWVDVYLPLLPHISPQKRAELIPEMLQIMRKRTTVRIGMALLPLISWLKDAPAEALWSPFAELTKFRFPNHLENLPDENETSVEIWQAFALTLGMQDMVDGIQRSSFTSSDYPLLSQYLNRLPAESRSHWFGLALQTAQNLERDDKMWHKAIVLARLSAWSAGGQLLSADRQSDLLAEAVQLAWGVKDKTDRSQALVHIAHCLPANEQLPLLQQALKKMGVPRWAEEARALKLALPLLPKIEAVTWLGKVLKKAGKLQDEPHRYATITVLNPKAAMVEAKLLDKLVKSWKDAARNGDDVLLVEILPHLPPTESAPWLEQVWVQTLNETWPRAKAFGLRQLLPFISADNQSEALTALTETALGISRQTEAVSITAEVGKPEELSYLVGMVSAEQKAYIVESALNAMLAMNKNWRGGPRSSMYALDYFLDQLERMIPHLEAEMAAHIWQASQKVLVAYNTWPVAALLYPQLPPALASEVKKQLVETLTSPIPPSNDPLYYAVISAIAGIKAVLTDSQWATGFKEAQSLASRLEAPVFRTRALLKLWPHFTGEQSYLALRDTLNALEAIPDVSHRQQELFRLIKHITNPEKTPAGNQKPVHNSSFMTVRLLRLATALNRSELLKALRLLAPVLARLEVGPDAAQAVEEIGTYFA